MNNQNIVPEINKITDSIDNNFVQMNNIYSSIRSLEEKLKPIIGADKLMSFFDQKEIEPIYEFPNEFSEIERKLFLQKNILSNIHKEIAALLESIRI